MDNFSGSVLRRRINCRGQRNAADRERE